MYPLEGRYIGPRVIRGAPNPLQRKSLDSIKSKISKNQCPTLPDNGWLSSGPSRHLRNIVTPEMEGLQQIDDLDRHFDSIKGPSDRAPRVSEAPSLPRSILEPIEEATDWGPKQFNISAGEATHTKTEESSSSEVDNQGNFTDRAKQTQSDTEDMPREANKQITNEANQTQADKVPAPEKSDSISTSISSLALVSHEFQAPEAPEAPIDPVGNKGDAPIPAPAASAGMIGGMEVCSASDGSHNEKQKLLPAVGVHDEQQPTAYRPVNAEETLTAGSSQQCHPNRDCQGYGKRSRDASPNSILRAHPFLGRITNWLVRQDDKSPPLTTTTCAFCDGNLMTNPLPYNVPEPQVHLPCGHKFDFLSVFEGLVKHHGEILRCPEPRCISIQHTCGHSATPTVDEPQVKFLNTHAEQLPWQCDFCKNDKRAKDLYNKIGKWGKRQSKAVMNYRPGANAWHIRGGFVHRPTSNFARVKLRHCYNKLDRLHKSWFEDQLITAGASFPRSQDSSQPALAENSSDLREDM